MAKKQTKAAVRDDEQLGDTQPPKKEKKESKDEILARLDRMWKEASEFRKQYDYRWFLYGMWVRGYHYARYDRKAKMVVGKPPASGRPQIVVNKIYPTIRGVRNYVLRNQPKAQVVPEDTTNQTAIAESMKSTRFLEYFHERQKLKKKLKGTVFQALETSMSWWQVIFDGSEIVVNPVDCFDYYFDPKANSPSKQRYGILAVSRRISELLEDDKYDKKEVAEIKPDNKKSSSSYKELLLSYDRGSSADSATGKDQDGSVIVKEFWYMKGDQVYVCATAGGRLIRKPEIIDTPIIPFFKLSSDNMPFSMVGEGWVKHMIDPQKLINSAMSTLAEYNLIMNKVKVIVDKGAGIRVFTNQMGEVLEKKRGYTVTTQASAPLNPAIYQQIDYANRFIEDIGAMHDAMMGRVPTGAKSGRAIESLQIGDSNNMSELVENLEEFLEDVYEYTLLLASKVFQDYRSIILPDYTGQDTAARVIGADSEIGQQLLEEGDVPDDTIVIQDKNFVDVKIGSFLSFTPEGKRDAVRELYEVIPDLPEDIILDAYAVGNIADVVNGIKKKRAEAAQQEMEQQRMQAEVQQDTQNPEATPQEAVAAIRTMLEGGTPQVPRRPGQMYIQVFDEFIERETELGEVDQQALSAIARFRDQVVQGVGARTT